MNILYHHRTRGEGAEGVHIRGVVKGLRQLNHNVSILSFPGSDPEHTQKKTEATKSPTKKNSAFKWLSELTKFLPEFAFEIIEFLYNIFALLRISSYVRNNKVDCIYERYSLFMFATVWLARKKNIPIILEINDSVLVERVRPLFFKSFSKKIESWLFQNATGLVFISSYFENIAKQNYQHISNSVVTPNSVDLDLFVTDEQQVAQLKSKYQLENKTVLGYVGAFVHWHGIDWFMDLISPKLKQHPNLSLLLVGDGVCLEKVKDAVNAANVSDQVIFTGRVDHQQIAAHIALMDYGILPDSNLYGSPMKLFEFMAMGKGMVAPDFAPIAEVVTNDLTSWLFSANDREACIEKVLSLSEKHDEHQRVGDNAKNYIIEQRQWIHNAQQLLGLIDNEKNSG
ncbi:glycosyltransferase family 4 protein [Thalassotalea crassostreae]|uniref:glycosyltransferase family 4 protein n=1 Tax=Thalassotalea crassostreae TaxID=1763536 RepID=UPI0008391525|nr:glycosyltransferase family 4 protein [Thalassotalea crassostreae]